MPRPGFSPNRPGAAKSVKHANPLLEWWESRKERRDQLEEEAASMITNKITENEATLIDQLNNIDFSRSELPKSVLEKKAREDMPYCELEFAVQGLIRKLQRSPQTIKIDIRKIDEKLLTLVLLLKKFVAQGDARAAYAAKGALVRGIQEIRALIPQDQPQLAQQFVEANSKYLDQWIHLANLAYVADRTKKNLDSQKESYAKAKSAYDTKLEELEKLLLEDPEFNKAYKVIFQSNSPEDRQKWTAIQRKAHRLMVDRRMDRLNVDANALLVHQLEMDLSSKESMVDMLSTKVASVEIVADPNLMNHYQEAMEDLIKQMAANDAEIDEMLKNADDLEGRIAQLNNAPGAVRAREVAAEEAELALKEIHARQELQVGKEDARHKARLKELGIFTKEELEQMRKQNEAAAQAQEAMIAQMIEEDNQEEEGSLNLN